MKARKAPRTLTYKQRMFVAYYLGECQGNATDAARKAGYGKPAEQGHENLKKPQIRAAIEAKLSTSALTADEVLARLSDFATASLGDFLAITPVEGGGSAFHVDLEQARKRGKLHVLKKVKQGEFGVEVELHNPVHALGMLAKYHGLLRERVEIAEAVTGDLITEADRIRRERRDRGL